MSANRKKEFDRYPKIRDNYIRTFDKMLKSDFYKIKVPTWNSGQDVYNWWVNSNRKELSQLEGQLSMM